MTRSGCYYCKSEKITSVFTVRGYTIVYCANCGLTYTKLPKSHNITDFNVDHYSENYLSQYEDRKEKLSERFRERIREIEKIKQGGKILDVGCSTGMFIDIMHAHASYKWQYYGIDINRRSIAYAKKNLKSCTFSITPVSKYHAKVNSFDVVTCFDVLEHDPLLPESLQAIYRLLKPGGLLIVQSPNYKSVMAKLCGDNWDWWSLPDHIIHLEPRVLVRILSDNKFKIKYMRTWDPTVDFDSNVRGTLKLKLPRVLLLNKIIAQIATPANYILHGILAIMEPYVHSGGLIRIVAQKI